MRHIPALAQIALAIVFLWMELGPSVLAGIAVMLLMIPINFVISMYMRKMQAQQMAFKDERLKMMNEVLNGMKVLKVRTDNAVHQQCRVQTHCFCSCTPGNHRWSGSLLAFEPKRSGFCAILPT